MYCKIFKTYNSNIISECQYYSGYLNFSILFGLQRYIFLLNLFPTSVMDDRSEIDRIDYREFSALKSKYKFEDNDSRYILKLKAWRQFEGSFDI